MYRDTQEIATAFTWPSLPVNPNPFVNALRQGLREYGMDWMKSDQAKGILFMLNQMAYGQLFTLDGIEEYNRLSKALTVGDIEPNNMVVIINIQTMHKVITGNKMSVYTWSHLSYDDLHDKQNAMIPEYNKMITLKNTDPDKYNEQIKQYNERLLNF